MLKKVQFCCLLNTMHRFLSSLRCRFTLFTLTAIDIKSIFLVYFLSLCGFMVPCSDAVGWMREESEHWWSVLCRLETRGEEGEERGSKNWKMGWEEGDKSHLERVAEKRLSCFVWSVWPSYEGKHALWTQGFASSYMCIPVQQSWSMQRSLFVVFILCDQLK